MIIIITTILMITIYVMASSLRRSDNTPLCQSPASRGPQRDKAIQSMVRMRKSVFFFGLHHFSVDLFSFYDLVTVKGFPRTGVIIVIAINWIRKRDSFFHKNIKNIYIANRLFENYCFFPDHDFYFYFKKHFFF